MAEPATCSAPRTHGTVVRGNYTEPQLFGWELFSISHMQAFPEVTNTEQQKGRDPTTTMVRVLGSELHLSIFLLRCPYCAKLSISKFQCKSTSRKQRTRDVLSWREQADALIEPTVRRADLYREVRRQH